MPGRSCATPRSPGPPTRHSADARADHSRTLRARSRRVATSVFDAASRVSGVVERTRGSPRPLRRGLRHRRPAPLGNRVRRPRRPLRPRLRHRGLRHRRRESGERGRRARTVRITAARLTTPSAPDSPVRQPRGRTPPRVGRGRVRRTCRRGPRTWRPCRPRSGVRPPCSGLRRRTRAAGTCCGTCRRT